MRAGRGGIGKGIKEMVGGKYKKGKPSPDPQVQFPTPYCSIPTRHGQIVYIMYRQNESQYKIVHVIIMVSIHEEKCINISLLCHRVIHELFASWSVGARQETL